MTFYLVYDNIKIVIENRKAQISRNVGHHNSHGLGLITGGLIIAALGANPNSAIVDNPAGVMHFEVTEPVSPPSSVDHSSTE